MTKTEAQKQTRQFCRAHGLTVNGSQGIPLLSKGEWLYCADDWMDAHAFLSRAHLAHIDHGTPYPWA